MMVTYKVVSPVKTSVQCSRKLQNTGCARSLRSLRLPSVARLEFTPMKIGAGITGMWFSADCFVPTASGLSIPQSAFGVPQFLHSFFQLFELSKQT